MRYFRGQLHGEENIPVDYVSILKDHLRIEQDDSSQDLLLLRIFRSAHEEAEEYMGRSLVQQRWVVDLDAWPRGAILLPRPPLQLVEFVRYWDGESVVTLPATQYRVESQTDTFFGLGQREDLGLIEFTGDLPEVNSDVFSPIRIYLQGGYGNSVSSWPQAVLSAVLLIAGRIYSFREDATTSTVRAIPKGATHLMHPYRIDPRQIELDPR